MKSPKSQLQIYEALKPLVPVMNTFKETRDGQLKADQVAILKDVHSDVNVFCGGCLPRVFNTNCGSCVREFFEVVISFFDRLAKNPDINKELKTPEQEFEEAENAKAADLLAANDLTPDEIKEAENASKALMSTQDEDTLLSLLGNPHTPDEYLVTLFNFVTQESNLEQLPESFIPKIAKRLEVLLLDEMVSPEVRLQIVSSYADTLPKDDDLVKALTEAGNDVQKEFEKAKEEQKDENHVDNETKDEVIDETRDGAALIEGANQPLNTPDTRTKWQKTADTKRINAAKKRDLAAGNPTE